MLDNRQDPLEKLRRFFEQTEDCLETAVKKITDIAPYQEEEFYMAVKEVWYSNIIEEINGIQSMLGSGLPPSMICRLESEGLTGHQLDLKMMLFDRRKKEFDEAIQENDDENRDSNKKKEKDSVWKGKIRKRFRKLANIINTILDSIAKALGIGGIIREFKDVLMHSADDADEKDREDLKGSVNALKSLQEKVNEWKKGEERRKPKGNRLE